MRRVLPLILIAAMLLSGCGGASSAPSGTAADNSEPTTTPTPKFAYSATFTSLADDADALSPVLYTDDGFYAFSMKKTGEDIPEYVINEAKRKGEEVENDGRYDVYSLFLSFVSYDGKIKELDKYSPLPDEENTDGWKNFNSVSEYAGLCEGEDGKLVSVEKTYVSGSSAPDNAADYEPGKDYNEFKVCWYIRTLDRNTGEVLSSNEIINEDAATFDALSMKYLNGRVYCLSSSSIGNGVTAIGLDGVIDTTALYVGYISKLIMLSSGNLAVLGYRDGTAYLSMLNTSSYAYTDIYKLADNVNGVFDGCGEYDFFFSTEYEYVGYNTTESKDEKLFSWSSVSVNPLRIVSDVRNKTGGEVVFFINDYTSGKYSNTICVLERSEYDESADRKVVTLYSAYASYGLEDAVASFNRENADIRLELTTQIEGADIVCLEGAAFREMALAGRLEDLYPYIDADSEINRSDFFGNIFEALEIDGKLYQSVSGFYINTVLGQTDVVGENSFWNYDEYYNALSSMGSDCNAFDVYVVRDDIFRACLATDLDWYVSWEEGYCNFANEAFASMLEFVNTFPESFDSANHDWDDQSDNSDLRIADGRQMLLRTSICSFDDACRCGYEFPGKISYKGFPTLNGSGNSVVVSTLSSGENFAISAESPNKSEAWSFIRTFFTEQYQKSLYYFPTNKKVFNERLADFRLEYLIDDDGEVMYDKKTGEPRKRALGTMYLSDYTLVYYYGLDEGKEAKFVSLVTSVNKVADYDEKVYQIVNGACRDFFDGKVSSMQAAENVQNKMTEYLNNVSINQKQ